MIFIYPASVSETCDKRIVPAVCKCIERFFLVQIQDAISDGVLRLSRKWDGRNYGTIQMESVNNYNKKQMLTESKYLTEAVYNSLPAAHNAINQIVNRARHEKNPSLVRDMLVDLDQIWQDIADSLQNGNSTITRGIRGWDERIIGTYNLDDFDENGNVSGKRQQIGYVQTHHNEIPDEVKEIIEHIKDAKDTIKTIADDLESQLDNRSRLAKEKREQAKESRDAEKHGWQRNEYEQKKKEWERENEEAAEQKERTKAGSIGGYMPMDTKVDIAPTCGQVTTHIMLNGGKRDGVMQDDQRININVKVIPTIIKNFKILERDLLDDYFTKKSEGFFKTLGRGFARACYNAARKLPFNLGDAVWEKGMMTVAGDDVTRESRKDIIYNTHGFVDASAFHKSSNSPRNYNFTSNIVIFNKDDLTDPDDQNIFQNRSAMVKLFKLGWSTFCMLDPVEEMMYFVSSLDGGYMHPIPYRYIMESFNSRAYYGTEEKLKDSAKPFFVKRGNFASFAKLFYKKR